MPVRVALLGIGNCASAFVQGLQHYRTQDAPGTPGLMHPTIGPYRVRDIEVVAAVDIDVNKVGKDVADAIVAPPNNTINFAPILHLGVPVTRGMTHDGIGRYVADVVHKSEGPTEDLVALFQTQQVDVVVNFLPVGSEMAVKWYAEKILQAGCAMVNCMPVFLASSPYWAQQFAHRGLPIIGDDVKSQVGATIVHRALAKLFTERGVRLDRTYQLNCGGNSDFLNMLERDRLASKKVSKTGSVQSVLPEPLPDDQIHVGPSDYIPWLLDRKIAFIRLEGTTFGGVPLNIEMKLDVWDSPNSAGCVIDAVRCAKIALDRGLSGPIQPPSAYYMKTPPVPSPSDDEARKALEDWIRG